MLVKSMKPSIVKFMAPSAGFRFWKGVGGGMHGQMVNIFFFTSTHIWKKINEWLGQIKLDFRFSSPPAPLKMPRPIVFYLDFFVVKSVYNVYIDQSKFKSYLPFVLKVAWCYL